MDEEFHGQVEDADGNRICRNDREGQVEEVHRICRGRRPGEEGEENPEEEFKDERIEEGPEPQVVVVMLQTVGEESCRDALDDGESAMDEGGVCIDEEGAGDADDGADGRPYDRSSDEAAEDDADGSKVYDAASGSDVPVRAAEAYDGEKYDENSYLLPVEFLCRDGLPEEGGAADEEKEQKE